MRARTEVVSMKPRRGKEGMKGMERIGQYSPEESLVQSNVLVQCTLHLYKAMYFALVQSNVLFTCAKQFSLSWTHSYYQCDSILELVTCIKQLKSFLLRSIDEIMTVSPLCSSLTGRCPYPEASDGHGAVRRRLYRDPVGPEAGVRSSAYRRWVTWGRTVRPSHSAVPRQCAPRRCPRTAVHPVWLDRVATKVRVGGGVNGGGGGVNIWCALCTRLFCYTLCLFKKLLRQRLVLPHSPSVWNDLSELIKSSSRSSIF